PPGHQRRQRRQQQDHRSSRRDQHAHRPGGGHYDNIAEMSARIAAASARTGIGLTLLPVHYQFGGTDRRPLAPGQNRFGTTPEEFQRLLEGAEAALTALPPDAGIGIAPHSLRAVSPEALRLCTELRPDRPLHMHLAEQIPEIEEISAAYGLRPVPEIQFADYIYP
ncbi:MAG TPA: hypothetical protein PLI13_17645, partial [Paracoccus sp. (in: a-proteobacteria)]|nr:hypothetical protein [Paracoccus sp. (in: a-proteobacteria)]